VNIEDKVTLAHIDKINSKRMDIVPRCYILFENSCKSKHTFSIYKRALDYFLKWSNKDYESLIMLSEFDKNRLMQDYVISLRRRCESGVLSPNSVPTYVIGIFKFLKVSGCNFNIESIKQLYPQTVKLAGDKAITTEQIKQILRTCRYKRERALIHFCSATGARPEAITEIQFKHISKKNGFLKIVLYALDKHEMITYLHPEAVKVLDEYLEWRKSKGEKLISESFLFVNRAVIPKKLSVSAIENIMDGIWQNSDVERVKIGNRYELAMFTCYRKRFDTILEMNPKVSSGACQYLMDHMGYLSGRHYRRPTEEQIFESYKNTVKELMIDDSLRKDYEFEQKQKEFEKIETQKDVRIEELESRAERTEILLQKVLERLDSS